MPDRDMKQLAFRHQIREWGIAGLRTQVLELAQIFQSDIAKKRAGKHSGLGQNLKSVAYADDKPAFFCEVCDGSHHGRKFCKRARSQDRKSTRLNSSH